jgi:inorganic pyrophosphatase
MTSSDFWLKLDRLVATNELIVDRPKGSPHPSYPALLYPLDYGYLDGTRSADGEGIDVWVGSLPDRTVTGIICSVDLLTQEAEIKILLGCTQLESAQALDTHNRGSQAGLLLQRYATGGTATASIGS